MKKPQHLRMDNERHIKHLEVYIDNGKWGHNTTTTSQGWWWPFLTHHRVANNRSTAQNAANY